VIATAVIGLCRGSVRAHSVNFTLTIPLFIQGVETDAFSPLIDVVWILDRVRLVLAVHAAELSSVDLLLAIQDAIAVCEECHVVGIDLVRPGLLHQRERSLLKRTVVHGVLRDQPGRRCPLLADQALPRPARALHDLLEPRRVPLIDTGHFLRRFQLLTLDLLANGGQTGFYLSVARLDVGFAHREQLFGEPGVGAEVGRTISYDDVDRDRCYESHGDCDLEDQSPLAPTAPVGRR